MLGDAEDAGDLAAAHMEADLPPVNRETPWWENGEEWTTRDGRVLKIVEMDQGHLANTIAYLRRRKGILFHWAARWR